MEKIQKSIIEKFGNRLRVRVCGICMEHEKILLINHKSLNRSGDFWAPPGGGMDFGYSSEANLRREFLEETGLEIEIEKFLFVHEYLQPPLHAIELIFKVKRVGGQLKLGFDPEMHDEEQILKDLKFIPIYELMNLEKGSLHQMFNNKRLDKINDLKGYFLSAE